MRNKDSPFCYPGLVIATTVPPRTPSLDEYYYSGMIGLVGFSNVYYSTVLARKTGASESESGGDAGGYFAVVENDDGSSFLFPASFFVEERSALRGREGVPTARVVGAGRPITEAATTCTGIPSCIPGLSTSRSNLASSSPSSCSWRTARASSPTSTRRPTGCGRPKCSASGRCSLWAFRRGSARAIQITPFTSCRPAIGN